MRSDHSLEGRIAVVTGGSRGIGLATARALAGRGATVITLSSNESSHSPADREWGVVDHLVADVADWESMRGAFSAVLDRFERIDFLANNAGVRGIRGPLWELDPEDYRRTLAVNTMGAIHGMKLALPSMIEQRSGVIVNTSSGAARRPRPSRSMYGASKAALDHLTLAVAQEVAEFGIRVHAFHSGPVDTALFKAARDDPGATQEELDALDARYSSGGVQPPEDVGAVISWLATPAGAAFGEVIVPWRDLDQRAAIREMALLAETRPAEEVGP